MFTFGYVKISVESRGVINGVSVACSVYIHRVLLGRPV